MSVIAGKHPGVENTIAFPGLSINGFTNSPNSGIVFVALKDFDQRMGKNLSAMRHAMGVAVFSGMIGVTFFGLLLTPLFYVLIRAFVEKREARKPQLLTEVHA